ncbi:MAG: hypothetical protein LBE91_08250 [Tannerella sp.]|jgi:hypothetical protein|nr:hypothetical protein [Tannerella sp.]
MTVLDFIEDNLPDYHRSNEIARLDDLAKFLDSEMDLDEMNEKGFVPGLVADTFQEYTEIENSLFERAMKNFIKK